MFNETFTISRKSLENLFEMLDLLQRVLDAHLDGRKITDSREDVATVRKQVLMSMGAIEQLLEG